MDKNGEFAEIFNKLEKIILSFKEIKVKKNKCQTSYYDEYKTVVMLRTASDNSCFVSSWGQGHKLCQTYDIFEGNGKIVRQINFTHINQIDEDFLREIIKETIILNMEDYELKQLRKNLK